MMLARFASGLMITLFVGPLAQGQHWHYSQYNFSEQRINPAQIAMSRFARASLNYRSQRTGGDFNINSNLLELTHPLLNPSTGQPWSAVSVNFHHDRSSGVFVTNEAALSYAVAVQLGRAQQLGFGGRALYQARSVDYSGFFTGSQYVPDRGFNTSVSSGENVGNLRTEYATFSTGLYWQQDDRRSLPQHYAGLAIYDLNRPPDSFLPGDSRLPSTLTFTSGWQWWKKRDLHLYSDLLITFSAGNAWTNLGIRLQKELQPRNPKNMDRVELLLRYVPLRSGIFGIQIHQGNLSLGLSYDFPVLYRNTGNLGALEVALQLRKLVLPKNRQPTARKKSTTTRNPVAAKPARIETQKPGITPDTTTIGTPAAIVSDSVSTKPKPSGAVDAGRITQHVEVVRTRQLHFHFEFNSSELDDESERLLEEFREELAADPTLRLKVEGFTDNVGHTQFNQRLSLKRAHAVCDFLSRSGIERDRLQAFGRGEEEPLNANSTELERAQNRRVVLTLYRE